MVHDRIVRVARHEDHVDLGMVCDNLLRKRPDMSRVDPIAVALGEIERWVSVNA